MLAKKMLTIIPRSIRTMRRLSGESLAGSVPFQQFRIMVLVHEGLGQGKMSELLQISPAAVSKMIESLVTKKLVARSPGKDRRSLILKLTSKGKKTYDLVSGHVEQRLEESLGKLSLKELGELDRGLSVLEKFMGLVDEN
jgi:DNA-binding MarR family transcriptional regulator